MISIHAPTWGATGAKRAKIGLKMHFNPRTHVGCDEMWGSAVPVRGHFNPRTHVGCDLKCEITKFPFLISIHAPTWGATRIINN